MESNLTQATEVDGCGGDSGGGGGLRKPKKGKQQQQRKLVKLVASALGADSVELFKRTLSAAATAAVADESQESTAGASASIATHTKTTKKLNRKFNVLQRKINSLIELGTCNATNKQPDIDEDEVSEVFLFQLNTIETNFGY